MKTLIRIGLTSAAALTLGLVIWAGVVQAQGKEKETVLKIADLLEQGKDDAAKKEAAAFAKGLDDPHDFMALMRPRKTKGIGVGDEPGKITPDGIEKKIQAIARDGITQGVLDLEAKALKKMAYHTAAMAEIAVAMKYPERDAGMKTKKNWTKYSEEMRSLAQEVVKSLEKPAPATLKTAVAKLNNNCNNCHSIFRN